jgi:predicted transcriptional regulator
MLIDIDALHRPRYAAPQISFRRNDNDRRPARVFVRPNDYAQPMEVREAESARRLEALKAKRLQMMAMAEEPSPAPRATFKSRDEHNKTIQELHREQREKQYRILMRALRKADKGLTIGECATRLGCQHKRASEILRAMLKAGLVALLLEGKPVRGQFKLYVITERGRVVLGNDL